MFRRRRCFGDEVPGAGEGGAGGGAEHLGLRGGCWAAGVRGRARRRGFGGGRYPIPPPGTSRGSAHACACFQASPPRCCAPLRGTADPSGVLAGRGGVASHVGFEERQRSPPRNDRPTRPIESSDHPKGHTHRAHGTPRARCRQGGADAARAGGGCPRRTHTPRKGVHPPAGAHPLQGAAHLSTPINTPFPTIKEDPPQGRTGRRGTSGAPSIKEDPRFALAAPARARTGRQAGRYAVLWTACRQEGHPVALLGTLHTP